LFSIEIGGVDKTANVLYGSLKISDAINSRSTASVDIIDPTGAYRPDVGAVVEVYDGATLVFAGTIDDLPEEKLSGASGVAYRGVPIVDYTQIADRKLVAESYENELAGDIVTDIITKYLADEGITAGDVQNGVTVSKAVFNYMTASECFDDLSELTGFQWSIKSDKTLDFFDRASYAGTAITESSDIWDVRVSRSRENYRNRQYLRAGQDIALPETRTFKGDGALQTFTVPLPIALAPTITKNGAAQTVGIRGLDTGKDWYWQKNDKNISQDTGSTKLISTDTLSVTYEGYFPIMVVSDDQSQIAARKAIEGGAGIYESIADKSSIDTQTAALEYSAGLLRRYATIRKSITLKTTVEFSAGQIISVTLPTHGISEDMLVESVRITTRGTGAAMQLVYDVKLSSGESFGGWVNFFKKLAEKTASFSIRENEILIKLMVFSDAFSQYHGSDAMTYHLHQYNICSTTTICSEGLIL